MVARRTSWTCEGSSCERLSVYVARGDLLICNSIVDLLAWDFDVGRRVLKRFWSSISELPGWCFEVWSGVVKRFWSSSFELSAWCFEFGSGVLKRFWSSSLELSAWCFEFGRGVFWVEKWCRGANF